MVSLRHAGVVVADLERALEFYLGVFGLQVVAREVETGPFIEALVGLPDVQLEWAKLAGSNEVLLELLCYHSHPEALHQRGVQSLGCSHVAFTVEDIHETVARIQARGGSAGEPLVNPQGTVEVVYARDPEGVLLEVVSAREAR